MKIGTSFSMCLNSIAKGDVALEDVAFIITSTAYRSREEMLNNMRLVMLGKNVETHMANAAALWDSGRIYQPSARPMNRRAIGLWVNAPPLFEEESKAA